MGRNDENKSELHQENIDNESTFDDTDEIKISSPDPAEADIEEMDDELTSEFDMEIPVEEEKLEETEEGKRERAWERNPGSLRQAF